MDRKKIILTIITFILFIIVFILASMLFNKYVLKKEFEENILSFAEMNNKTVFKVNKIILFSSSDAKNKTSSISNYTVENLYQYTDIAIFINNNSTEEKTLENTFKKVSINNIKFNQKPETGEPKLYFKSLNKLATSEFNEENEITDNLDFNITSENEADLNTPTLYNNLANPITLSYVNQNVKNDYTITDTSTPITYDGSLLKRCNIDLSSISCNLSFDINITNNLDEEFKSSVFIDIPLESEDKSIYDGYIHLTKNTNFIFYRYK